MATVVVHEVDAGAAVQTGISVAIVYVRLTVHSGISGGASTLVAIDLIVTRASVPARVGATVIDLVVTVYAGVPWKTGAVVTGPSVFASAMVVTWVVGTGPC